MRGVTLTSGVRESTLDHGASAYPFEGCGLLIGYHSEQGVRVSRALPCPNGAAPEERTHRFVIDPRAVLNVRRSLRGSAESVVGFYHSHPDATATPSATDMEFIRLWPETVWLIVPVSAGEASAPRAWWLDDAEAPAARELSIEVLPARDTRVTTCPE